MLITNMDLNELVAMKEEDLRELLVENNVNSQELRETIYRLKKMVLTYKSHAEYLSEVNEELDKKLETIKGIY